MKRVKQFHRKNPEGELIWIDKGLFMVKDYSRDSSLQPSAQMSDDGAGIMAPAIPISQAGEGTGEVSAAKLGRGFIFILFAKVWFMIMGFAVQFGLPRLFQRAASLLVGTGRYAGLGVSRVAEMLYGDYGVSVRTVSWINNTMVQGTIQTVSKYVSEDEGRAMQVKAVALRMQALLGGALALIYFLLADVGASILGDGGLAKYFRITAIIILAYSVYAVLIGYLNGLKKFKAQAGFDVAYSSMKTFFMLGAAALGFGVSHVLWGFSGAAILICLVAALVVGVRGGAGRSTASAEEGTAPRFTWRMLLGGMSQVVLYFIIFNFLLGADLWIVKALAGRVGGAALSSALAGVYTGVQSVALVPYQAVLAVAFVAFPVISKSTFQNDTLATKGYIDTTMRYSAIFVVLVAAILAAVSTDILTLIKPSFAAGDTALRIYLAGEVCFALLAIANTIIIASGKMMTAVLLAFITLILDVAANLLIVPGFLRVVAGADGGMALDTVALVAASAATAGAYLVGFIAASVILYRSFKARLTLSTVCRVLVAGVAAAFAASLLVGMVSVPLVVKILFAAVLAAVVYLGILLVSREFGSKDLERVLQVVRHKKTTNLGA